jgi:23S rRNA (uracil1939-C5)-methyltransferase
MEPSIPKNFVSEPFPYHHRVELEITSLTNLGVGLGKIDGWVVMVPYTIPGERVIAKIFRNHKNYSDADLVEILSPSDARIEPICPYYQSCGGCQYQHIDYSSQLEWKRQHVVDVMQRIGNIDFEVNQPIHSESIYGYRSKITPHFNKPRNQQETPIGFMSSTNRNRIIDVEQCAIATPSINEKLIEIRSEYQNKIASKGFKKGATILLRDVMEGVISDHKAVVTERVGKRIFQFKAGDFFQNNPYVLPKMVDYVVRQASSNELPYLIDAYCGSGLFSICASGSFDHCYGVEISDTAIHWARTNSALNQLKNCTYSVGKAESIFDTIPAKGADCSLIIDPPRKGCDGQFLEQVGSFAPGKIVYVSCDPSTQARDLVSLLSYGYKILEIQPVDLFPQTRHIENVVTFQR